MRASPGTNCNPMSTPQSPRPKTTATPKGTVYYFSLNMKNPILAKPEVREAFKWLVDYAAIGDTFIKNIGAA